MSLLHDNNMYDVGDIQGIESVLYDGDEILENGEPSILEAFNRKIRPQYDMINYWGNDLDEEVIRNYNAHGDSTIDRKNEEFERNQQRQLEIIFDTVDGEKSFYLEDNNKHASYAQERPRSSAKLVSDDGAMLGLRVMRDIDDDSDLFKQSNFAPAEWKGDEIPAKYGDDCYEIQERDMLTALDRIEGVDDTLEQIIGAVPIGRSNYKIAEDSEGGTESSFDHSKDETALLYNYSPHISVVDPEELAVQLGKYAATMEALSIGRKDRETDEFMFSSDGRVYETDQEMMYHGTSNSNEYDLITRRLDEIAGSNSRLNDPREVEHLAKEAYRNTDLGDLSHLVPEKMTEWDLDNFKDSRIL